MYSFQIQTDAGRSNLFINEATLEDAGCYSVTAKNKLGETTVSCNVSVKSILPAEEKSCEILSRNDIEPIVPKIQLPLKDVQVQESCTTRLDCVIVGQPEPEVYHSRIKLSQVEARKSNCSLTSR